MTEDTNNKRISPINKLKKGTRMLVVDLGVSHV